jgi:uncharacterized protein (TIGR00730 family)
MPTKLRSVCVFCGSRVGANTAFSATATALGTAIARRGWRLVYGGGRVGLMGVVADAALAAGGEVVGVIPAALATREVAHAGLSELRVVETMHMRKALMAELSDGFVALPGGFGTLDELCEALTWAQLGIHAKPCALLNVDDYFAGLLAFFDHAVATGFLAPDIRALLRLETDPERLLDALENYAPPAITRWVTPEEI